MTDQLVQECWLQKIGFFADEWLLCQDDLFGSCGIGRQEAPIDVAPVPEIRVVRVLGGKRQDRLDQLLCLVWLLQEQLDDGSHQLKLDLMGDGNTYLF